MLGGFLEGSVRIIRLLVIGASGDLVVLNAEMAADARLVEVRSQVLVVKIEPHVAVEVPVGVITGISFDRAPHLLAGFSVTPQRGDAAAGTDDWGVDAELRPRLGE